MKHPPCPRCGTTWTGIRIEHCSACCETFTGTSSGDMHRTGRHDTSTGPERRRCLSVAEMEGRGMKRNDRGQWTTGKSSPSWWDTGDLGERTAPTPDQGDI